MKKTYKSIICFIVSLIMFTALYCLSVSFYIAVICAILTSAVFMVVDYLYDKNRYVDILLLSCLGISLALPIFIKSRSIEDFLWDFIKFGGIVIACRLTTKSKPQKNDYPIPLLDRL